jgi:hypothetical protein
VRFINHDIPDGNKATVTKNAYKRDTDTLTRLHKNFRNAAFSMMVISNVVMMTSYFIDNSSSRT